jgi:hypothetical protein
MPIGAMPNVGDIWQVTLGGKYISSTDNKSARVRAGTTSTGVPIMLSAVATALNQTSWAAIIKFMKIGFNAQNVWVMSTIGSSSNAFSGTNVSTGAFQETLVNNFVVTGQNATNPVASSVTCQYMQIEYFAVSQ